MLDVAAPFGSSNGTFFAICMATSGLHKPATSCTHRATLSSWSDILTVYLRQPRQSWMTRHRRVRVRMRKRLIDHRSIKVWIGRVARSV